MTRITLTISPVLALLFTGCASSLKARLQAAGDSIASPGKTICLKRDSTTAEPLGRALFAGRNLMARTLGLANAPCMASSDRPESLPP